MGILCFDRNLYGLVILKMPSLIHGAMLQRSIEIILFRMYTLVKIYLV